MIPDSQYVELAVEIFRLLTDATRVRIILVLPNSGELSVNHLADIVDKSPQQFPKTSPSYAWPESCPLAKKVNEFSTNSPTNTQYD